MEMMSVKPSRWESQKSCLTEENPNSDIQAALNAGYRHIDCAWEYGVLHVHTIS